MCIQFENEKEIKWQQCPKKKKNVLKQTFSLWRIKCPNAITLFFCERKLLTELHWSEKRKKKHSNETCDRRMVF